MHKFKSLAAAVGAAFLASAAQAATVQGTNVTIGMNLNGSDYGTETVLAVDGTDVTYFGSQLVDFDAGANNDLFTLTSAGSFSGLSGGINIFTLTGLDFGAPLIGFNVINSVSPVTIDSLTSNSVTFRFGNAPISGNYLTAQFITGTGAVPEPAAWALMIGGFGLAGATLRRRRVAYAA